MEFKGTKGKWEVTFHKSLNNACELSCIQNENHDNLPTDLHIMNSYFIDYSEVQRANALLISKSPEILKELLETLTDLKILRNQIASEVKNNHLFEGMPELMDKWIERKEKLIKEATEL
jgi:hypothetical protein